ncbi:MAG TPA: peptide ABC transporter substrate-binding protein [Candidatus Limnocylindrales bacterium]|nr:peptide ABC transporter substrate-binding protein [Candidatus Limnocylindrales bacterium]
MRKLVGLLAGAAILVAACGGTSTTPAPATTAPTTAPATEAPATQPASEAPSASEAPAEVDLFGTTYAPEAGATGGTIIIGDWQEATQFNPYYYGQVTEANVASLVWHTLLTISNDFRYVPQLAAEPIPTTANGGVTVGQNGDAMTVTWKLRDGLKWSDGEPLTCDDYKYVWEWILNKDNVGVVTAGWSNIKDFECASDTDMILHFDAIYSGYLTLMSAPLPRHFLEKIPVADQVKGVGFSVDTIANLPISGPFKFESVTPQAELRLVRNDNYVGARSSKPANLDGVIFKWYGDPDAMIAGFRAGEIDIAFDLQDSDIPKVQDLGEQVQAIPALLYEFLRPNWSPKADFKEAEKNGGCSRNAAVQDRGDGCPTADPALRAAIAYAIDKNEINTRLLGGNAQVANTNISPAAWFFADQAPATYDPAQAQKILADGGWADSNGDGFVEKDGVKAKIELCTTTRQVRQDTLALISAWLKAVGIDSVINPVAASDIFADYNEATLDTPCALSTSNFDLAEHAFSSSIDPLGNYFSYHSSQLRPPPVGGANDARVQDPDIDKSMDDVKNNVDFAVIRDAMATFQKVYVEKTVEIPLYYRKNVELEGPRIGNFFANGTQVGSTWNGEDWFAKN